LIEYHHNDTVPEVNLHYANILLTKGDIPGAKDYFEKYLEQVPGNPEATTGLRKCDWILANQGEKAQVHVYPLKSVNSEYDDFGVTFSSENFDQIIFTSNRIYDKVKSKDQWTGSTFSDLYVSSWNGKSWSKPEPLKSEGKINSDLHEGTPSVGGDFQSLYFTRCGKMVEDKAYCQIWMTRKIEGEWTRPELVISDSVSNVGQPAISQDELSLIFASDMEGSIGGKDLWIARRKSREEEFGTPERLGPTINTKGDEVFPHLFNDTLYFSSNGREGYGAWDLYKSFYIDNSWSPPVNLQEPFNSGYDDFAIAFRPSGQEGCFCSNRPEGSGGDDIYMFTRRYLLFTVSGQVKDNNTLLSMKKVKVMLVKDAKDTSIAYSDRHGRYHFDTTSVPEDHNYELIFRQDNYFSIKEEFSTLPYRDDHDFTFDIKLDPIPEEPIVLPDILYALDKWDLQPQYQDSLMQLTNLLKDNENLVIELRSHTDSRGSDEYNDVLSQKRAQSVVDFLVTQGIDPGRLVAKGYGERIVRVLDKDLVRENYRFKAGTKLTDEYIKSLPKEDIREAAYQLNRRTEFAVLAKDYKPGSRTAAEVASIQVVSDSAGKAIDYTVNPEGRMLVTAYINDFTTEAIVDPSVPQSMINESLILDLLQKGALSRDDFQGNYEEIVVDDRVLENSIVKINKTRIGEIVISESPVNVKNDNGQAFVIGMDLLGKAGTFVVDEESQKIIFK
jgi:peptidoglycan-associated lipoprotein